MQTDLCSSAADSLQHLVHVNWTPAHDKDDKALFPFLQQLLLISNKTAIALLICVNVSGLEGSRSPTLLSYLQPIRLCRFLDVYEQTADN